MIYINQHTSAQYGPRTKHNADQGVTVAIAVDHTTAGERLTQKYAAHRIIKITPEQFAANPVKCKMSIATKMAICKTKVLNIAGNGIYTWSKHGYDQYDVNELVYKLLEGVNLLQPIEKIVSGGQSGTDLAGLIAGAKLGIPSHGMWPKGYKMRFEDGVDVYLKPQEIMEMINSYA